MTNRGRRKDGAKDPPRGAAAGKRSRRRAAGAQREQPARRGGGGTLLDWAKSILVALALFFLLRSFLIKTFVITSGSMEDTLLVGDVLVVNRAALGSRVPLTSLRVPGYSEPHRGAVIVFHPPPPDTIGMELVKRLIGLPGDTLQMRDAVLYIDGQAQDEPYVKHSDLPDETHPWMAWQRQYLLPGVDPRTYAPTRDNWGPLVIPPGRYFMMGDNRDESLDSRYWGLVERWRLEGRVRLVYFSYNKQSYRPFPWLREIRWGRIGTVIHAEPTFHRP